MALLALSRDDAVQNDGHIYYKANEATDFTELNDATAAKPANLQGKRVRPILLRYRGRVYMFGFFSTPAMVTEARKVNIMGIPAPPAAPTLAVGTSSGGSTGLAIAYLTFVEKDAGKVIHESNPSQPSATISLNGQGRAWTVLPTSSINPRVTHIRGYVSMDGALPAFAWERQIGVTSVNENVLTGQLGERLPLFEGPDNQFDVDPFARGVPPNGRYAEVYHDSMWISGDFDFPTRIYFSRLFEPESFNTTIKERGWLETLDGEAVTGLKRWGDLLFVGCLRAMYVIQGFSAGDYQIVKVQNYYGCISNASMQLVGPDSDLWGAGQEGVWMYNGSFHDLMEEDLRGEWRDDYRANQINYEDCFAAEDRFSRTYQLVIPQDDESTFKWVGHWVPVTMRGAAPWWVHDIRTRQDNAIGSLIISNDDHYGELLTGSCDGFIRKENVQDDPDDDGDSYQKALTLQTKHFFFGDQGGDDAHGRNFPALDVFLQNESTSVTLSAKAGDDSAQVSTTPQWSRTISAGAVSTPRAKVARTSLSFNGLSEINGKGITLRFTATAPLNVRLRGFAIYHTQGEQERLFST